MPPVIAYIADVLVAWGMGAGLASFIASFVVSSALSYAVGMLTKANTGGYTASLADRQQVVRSSIQTRNIIYGEIVTSGPLIFAASSNASGDGGVNKYLHLVIALAGHEVEDIPEIFLGDVSLGTLDSNGFPTGGIYNTKEPALQTVSIALAAGAIGFTLGEAASSIVAVVYGANTTLWGVATSQAIPSTLSTDGVTITFTTPLSSATTVTCSYVPLSTNYGWVRVKKHLGSPTQAADADLIAQCPSLWTTAHRLQGIAYIYVRLEFSVDKFPTGIPNIKAHVKGKKVFDPRTSTTYYTPNYALCMYDYMLSPDGIGCATTDIDTASVIAAANICDEQVLIAAAVGAMPAIYQSRYVANGAILLDHSPEENMRQLSTAGGGSVPVLAGGVFRIYVGAYDTPTVSLSESDLRDNVKMRPRQQRRDLFNAVSGTYVDGDGGTYQPTDFPMVVNALYQSQDDGEQIVRDIVFPFTTNNIMAQRLAKIALERSRQGIVVEFPCKVSGFQLQAGDTVMLSLAKFGWSSKVFRVLNWTFNTNSGVDLVLQEEAAGSYAWNNGEQTTVDLSPDTNLPDPNYIDPISALTFASGSNEMVRGGDGTIITRLHVSWAAPLSAQAYGGGRIEVQYKRASELNWTHATPLTGDATDTYISPVMDLEIYIVGVRAVSNRGITSAWTYAMTTIVGNTESPPDVSAFALTVRADGTRSFSWPTANMPLNVVTGGGYAIRYRVATSGTPWASMTPLHAGMLTQSPFETHSPADGVYDFGIEALNASGNGSADAQMIFNFIVGAADFLDAKSGTSVANDIMVQTMAALNAKIAANKAETAQATADAATAEITNISSDGILSKGEKSAVILDYTAILNEQAGIDAQADAFGQSRTAYDAAITALTSYLTGLAPAYNDTTTDTVIVAATFRSKFTDVYGDRQLLENAIATKAATMATWTGIIGTSGTIGTGNVGAIIDPGTIGTGLIGANAATESITNYPADTDVYRLSSESARFDVSTISYTATTDCELVIRATGLGSLCLTALASGMSITVDFSIGNTYPIPRFLEIPIGYSGTTQTVSGAFSIEQRQHVVSGYTANFALSGGGGFGITRASGDYAKLLNIVFRLEIIKR